MENLQQETGQKLKESLATNLRKTSEQRIQERREWGGRVLAVLGLITVCVLIMIIAFSFLTVL